MCPHSADVHKVRARGDSLLGLAELSLGRGSRELVLVSCCMRGTRCTSSSPAPVTEWTGTCGQTHQEPALPMASLALFFVHITGGSPDLQGRGGHALAGKQRPFVPSCRQMLGPQLCHLLCLPLPRGLCSHLSASAR